MAPPPGSDLTVSVVDIFRSPILMAGRPTSRRS
jgi:hypothetical protein